MDAFTMITILFIDIFKRVYSRFILLSPDSRFLIVCLFLYVGVKRRLNIWDQYCEGACL